MKKASKKMTRAKKSSKPAALRRRSPLSVERMHFAFAAIDDALWDWDIKAEKVFWNARYFSMFGYAQGEVKPSYGQWRTMTHPDDMARVEKLLQEHLSGARDSFEAEFRMRHSSGQWIWVLARGKVLARDKKGAAVRMVGMFSDISERKRIEETFLSSEKKFRLLFSTMSEGMAMHEVLYDAQGIPVNYRILEVNPGYERIVGVPRENVIGKLGTEVYRTPLPPYLEVFSRVARTGRPEHLEVFFAPHKKYYWITISSPGPGKFNTVFMDMTLEKNAIDGLKRSELRFRQMVENVPGAVYRCEVESPWRMDYMSDGIYIICGRPAEYFNSGKVVYADIVYPEDLGRVEKEVGLAVAEHRIYELEYRVIHTDGAVHWVHEKGQANYRPDGTAEYLEGVVLDITARREAEQGLIVSLEEKELLLQELNHRVKNNLQLIMSLFNLQMSRAGNERDRMTLRDALGRIKSIALVHEKLYQSPHFSGLDLKSYFESLIDNIVRSIAGTSGAVQVIVTVAEGGTFNIDKAIPCGLIMNELVTNAFKHAFPEGKSGIVEIKLDPIKDKAYALRVSDNGIGLPAEIDLETVPTLGLKLVNTLAHSIGTIAVDRSQGTKFTITFEER